MNAITKYIFSVGNPPGKWSLENQEREGRKILKLIGKEMICGATKWIMIMPSGRLSITNISDSVLTYINRLNEIISNHTCQPLFLKETIT